MFMDSNKTEEFVLIGIENYKAFEELLKTIPFNLTYGHLGYSYSNTNKKLIISITTKKCRLYKIIKLWIKDKQIKQSHIGEKEAKI